jgi:hypothetical protein
MAKTSLQNLYHLCTAKYNPSEKPPKPEEKQLNQLLNQLKHVQRNPKKQENPKKNPYSPIRPLQGNF